MGGSLFPADHSGIAGILFGLVGFVLFGVTLILVINGQLQTGPELSESVTTGGETDAQIAGLEKQVELLRNTHEQRMSWQAGLVRLAQSKGELASLEDDARRLRQELARERVSTAERRQSFAEYRVAYRKRLWADAVGHRMDKLRLPGGKVYQAVRILSVSAIGLKISHESGSAMIPVRELPADIVRTYHLNHGEARRLEQARE